MVDGVISLIDLRVYSLYDGNYSSAQCPLPKKNASSNCCSGDTATSYFQSTNSNAFEIDLDAIDHVLYNDIDSMFEIKYPETDIQIRVKLR